MAKVWMYEVRQIIRKQLCSSGGKGRGEGSLFPRQHMKTLLTVISELKLFFQKVHLIGKWQSTLFFM